MDSGAGSQWMRSDRSQQRAVKREQVWMASLYQVRGFGLVLMWRQTWRGFRAGEMAKGYFWAGGGRSCTGRC